MYHTAWTDIWIPALRGVDLEPSAKEGAKRIEALVSLYWSSRSLHLKSLLTQSHKSQPRKNLSDRLELEKSLAKSLNSMLFSMSKTEKQGHVNVNRLFVLSVKNDNDDPIRDSFDEHYILLLAEIKEFNALIDNKTFFS